MLFLRVPIYSPNRDSDAGGSMLRPDSGIIGVSGSALP